MLEKKMRFAAALLAAAVCVSEISAGGVTVSAQKSQVYESSGENKSEKKSITDSDVSLSQTIYQYDGESKTPYVIVTCDGVELKETFDFEVVYENNVEVGTATVIVTGEGNYEGTVTKNFTIRDLKAEGFDINYTTAGGRLKFYRGEAREVVVPDIVEEISWNAFADCKSVVSITIPKGIQRFYTYQGPQIPSGIPFTCSSLEELNVDAENETYASEDGILYNKDMTALIRCPQGKTGTVDIPESVTFISGGAFSSCSKLTGITVPGSVETIGEKAFSGCSSLTALVLQDGVAEIGAGAFSSCSSLESITIPKSVESISVITGYVGPMTTYGSPFSDCHSLREIKVDAGNPAYVFENGVLYNKDKTELVLYVSEKLTEVDIPGTVVQIGDGAFAGCGLKNITIPSGVKAIGKGAFSGCDDLTDVIIPSGVARIGEQAFYDCGSLTSVIIPEGVEEIEFGTFAGCGLKDIVIPSGVKTIGSMAFYDCDSLTSVTIPESVEKIEGMYGSDIFSSIEKLTIYGKAGSFAEIYAKEHDIKFSSESPARPVEKKKIADSGVSLSQAAYTYDGTAKKPNVTVKDGSSVLKEGTDYTAVYKNNVNAGTASVTVTGIGNYQGTVTKNFTITVKKGSSYKIGSYQYKVTSASTVQFHAVKNKKIVKVKVPKEVGIGGKNFKVTAIGNNALKNNRKITSVEISNNIKNIGVSAFEGCVKLSKVTIGTGTAEIGSSAFKNCRKLGNIIIKSTKLKKAGKNALKGIKSTAKIKVPAKKLSAYKKLFKNKGQGGKVKVIK